VTRHPAVVVVGDALLDVSARPATPIRPGADVPAEVRIGCGGQGANLAVRLARRGVPVELVCALGNDPGGTLLREELMREGVGLSAVPAAATGTVVILLDQLGERTMLSHRVPFAREAAAAIRDDAAWLVVSGYLLLEPAADDLAATLGSRPARRVVVGCAMPDGTSDRWARAVTELRPDLVVLNRDEARALLPGASDTDDLAEGLGDRLGAGIVVTDRSGATARLNGLHAAVRPVDATTLATDTTGAGDAFSAALVAALLRSSWPPSAEALEAGLTAAGELASAVAHAVGAVARVAGEPDGTLRP
jgi:sugar/nucleoside kinase (ribokinase family)